MSSCHGARRLRRREELRGLAGPGDPEESGDPVGLEELVGLEGLEDPVDAADLADLVGRARPPAGWAGAWLAWPPRPRCIRTCRRWGRMPGQSPPAMAGVSGCRKIVFTESAFRPIQSESRDVRLSVCLSPPREIYFEASHWPTGHMTRSQASHWSTLLPLTYL